VLVAVLTVLILAWTVAGFRRSAGVPLEPAFAADKFRPNDDPLWPRHWVEFPGSWEQPGVQIDSEATVAVVRSAITEMPSPQREVIVARDIEGRSAAEVRQELDLDPSDERDLLNQARGLVRARLNDYFEEHGK
jgi:DNA-directed RNA polymerase specialized sigma24 family protein